MTETGMGEDIATMVTLSALFSLSLTCITCECNSTAPLLLFYLPFLNH